MIMTCLPLILKGMILVAMSVGPVGPFHSTDEAKEAQGGQVVESILIVMGRTGTWTSMPWRLCQSHLSGHGIFLL